MKNIILLFFLSGVLFSCQKQVKLRKDISLNGTWEIAKSNSITQIPENFTANIQVPGLVDLAVPEIDTQDTVYSNSIYWYKRTFKVDDLKADVIQLKINKSSYHTWVYINRKLVGENVYNFTPSLFNVKPFLKEKNDENELIIAVGCRNNLPDTVTHGGDFEKIKYIPGIYDNVKLVISGSPFITNVQTIPDIPEKQIRVVAEIQKNETAKTSEISYSIREATSKKVVANGTVNLMNDQPRVDFSLKIPDCQFWSPENPFLYDLELRTSGDNLNTRFGMRSFAASKDSGMFLLNGKPYFMRGTNVCIFRFFEDNERKDLPWNASWATLLHSRFKEMNWNSIRYCIGFPPEKWYEIADSLGFLIQDEFPIWTGGKGGFEQLMGKITASQVAAEYTAWMRERWNHPCVVVWDAENESVNDTTGKAIQLVRHLDLSNRPWDNGWAAPMSTSDAIESHPYLFSKYMGQKPGNDGYLKELLQTPKPIEPRNDPNEWSPAADGKPYPNPVILNEYGWLWLNRDGSATALTKWVYANAFPEANTSEKRFDVYAKACAILTEYWRTNRKAAAVMHFCGLGYARPTRPFGQTSDNFCDIQKLTYEPHFYHFMKQAFSPVGLMTEFWEKSVKSGQQFTIPVHLINDTYETVSDSVKLSVFLNDKLVNKQVVAFQLDGLKKKLIDFPVEMPHQKGNCRIESEIKYNHEPIQSIREFVIE